MALIQRETTQPLRVGGEFMLILLRNVKMDTLEQIAEDLRPMDLTSPELIRTVNIVLASRRLRLLEEGDTVSMDDDR